MVSQAERRASTRRAILDAAQVRFGEAGYELTSIAAIQRAAGVSRGALYHHFSSKEDVFAAVFGHVSAAAVRKAGRAIDASTTPLDRLRAACDGWLDVVADPAVGRILLDDGPAALGWTRARELEGATSLGAMRRLVGAAVDAGQIEVESVDVTARLLNALVSEVAILERSGADRGPTRRALATVIGGFAPTDTAQ